MKKKLVVMLSAVMLMAVPVCSFAAVANNEITSAKIKDGEVKTADIANLAVTTAKIADGAVTAAKLGIVCSTGQTLTYNATTKAWLCGTAPAGPAGPQGIQGPVGPAGPQGTTAKYANLVVVAKSGGDFTDPASAANSITDASAANPYLIKVMPGVYDVEQTVVLKPYVSLDGSGSSATTIRGTNLADGVVNSNCNNTVSNVRIESTSNDSSNLNIALKVAASLFYTPEAAVKSVVLSATGNSSSVHALHVNFATFRGDDIKAFATGANYSVGMYIYDSSAQISNSVAVGSGGAWDAIGVQFGNGYHIDGQTFPTTTFDGLVAEGNSGNQSIGFFNSLGFQKPRIRNSRLTGSSFSLYNWATSYDGTMYVANSELNGPTKVDTWSGTPTTNICAGVTDNNGAFYANSCP